MLVLPALRIFWIAIVAAVVATVGVYIALERNSEQAQAPAAVVTAGRPSGQNATSTSSAGEPFATVAATVPVATSNPAGKTSFDLQSIHEALTSITPPIKPVRDILAAFRNEVHPTENDKLSAIAALSYCSNTKASAELARAIRSSGGAAAKDGALESLDKQHEGYSKYCPALSTEDYLLRSQILLAAADAGSRASMLAFYEVGPAGTWYESDLQSLGPERVEAWHAKAADLLISAAISEKVSAHTAHALASLITLFKTPSTDMQSGTVDPFARQRDDKQAYAYALAYSELLRASKSNQYESFNSQTLSSIAKNISVAEQSEALRRAKEILQKMGVKN